MIKLMGFFLKENVENSNYLPCSWFPEQNGGSDSVIQGSRKTSSSPWVTDAGAPLPFTADFLGLSNVSGALNILASSSGKWVNINPSNTFSTAVCEI